MSCTPEEPALPPVTDVFPHLHSNPSTLPLSVDPFTITTSTGFLPFKDPQLELPSAFAALNKLLDDFAIVKQDGTPGLLATYELGPAVDGGVLPDLTHEIDNLVTADGERDLAAVTAAFRDYSFLASAYLLEPCWETWSKDNKAGYGLGRPVLPRSIAGPLVKTADILDLPPFMSYAASYALYNYKFIEPSIGPSVYSNLRLIRAFECGLDAASSEAGFILTHVHMVQLTAPLIAGCVQALSSIEFSPVDRTALHNGLNTILSSMAAIEASMETMWTNSLPKDYISYRTFIFGITNQSMFPHGVVYEGYQNETPQFFRGESGANDSIIPLLDHLLEIPMPNNPLTAHLKEFRSYRPKPHRQFLSYIASKSNELGVREYCVKDRDTTVLYLRLLDHVRSFRWRHWLFAREYIIKRSSHPTATGGSPIVTWLPNQLGAVMTLMEQVYDESGLKDEDASHGRKGLREMMENVTEQKERLEKEVQKYCAERGV